MERFAEPESSAALIQTVPTILDCAEEPAEVRRCVCDIYNLSLPEITIY